MSSNSLIDKVHKLLRLSERAGTPEEAASAAAMAQRLIDEHNLSGALLAHDGAQTEPDEPIRDFSKLGAPLDAESPNKLIRWKAALAMSLCEANGCRTWSRSGVLHLVGRPSDADTVRYLYSFICYETERLTKKDGAGCGRTWKNNYRLGVVDTITRKLRSAKREFIAQQRKAVEGQSTALMRINSALAKVEQRGTDAQSFMDGGGLGFKLKGMVMTQGRHIGDAREAGRQAGESINLNAAKGALAGGARRLS